MLCVVSVFGILEVENVEVVDVWVEIYWIDEDDRVVLDANQMEECIWRKSGC